MTVRVISGDCRENLKTLPDHSVHAICTSPPYYGLRSYGVGGAEIGHESTPDEYAARLVAVFHEARRTLRPDGSLWLVLGDSYTRDIRKGQHRPGDAGKQNYIISNGGGIAAGGVNLRLSATHKRYKTHMTHCNFGDYEGVCKYGEDSVCPAIKPTSALSTLKEKDLIGIPWLVAFALRADGWYLREAIVWRKSSCMPESVTDRCTMQHEYVFHLTKSPSYYHDSYAIAEPAESTHGSGNGFKREARVTYGDRGSDEPWDGVGDTRNARSVWDVNPEPFEAQMCLACGTYHSARDYRRLPRDEDNRRYCLCGTNDRWLSHFAVFPTRLVSRCLRVSTPDGGCCATCGAPYQRTIESKAASQERLQACGADSSGGYAGASRDGRDGTGAQDASATKARILAGMKRRRTIGWQPACTCETSERVPALVLDPFSGAGTTALCAARLGRDAIGIDLNPDYVRMSMHRLRNPLAKCLDADGQRLPFATCETFAE